MNWRQGQAHSSHLASAPQLGILNCGAYVAPGCGGYVSSLLHKPPTFTSWGLLLPVIPGSSTEPAGRPWGLESIAFSKSMHTWGQQTYPFKASKSRD